MADIISRAEAGGVPVFCGHDQVISLDALKPHPRNPNRHPERQLRLLGDIIKRNGWRHPIVVSALSGLVIKGHGRAMAAKMAGLSHVPVEIQQYGSEADEAADMIADNRIAELSDMDAETMQDLIRDLEIDGASVGIDNTSDGTFEKAFDNPVKEPQEIKFPIMILKDETEWSRFEALKKRFKVKKDEDMFTICMSTTEEHGND
jgi:ParB-like chromosome segregation protein Spo0J